MRKLQRFSILFCILSSPLMLFAQGNDPGTPCSGDGDPQDNIGCPLDTWVFWLVVIVLVAAVYHLHQKQKKVKVLLK